MSLICFIIAWILVLWSSLIMKHKQQHIRSNWNVNQGLIHEGFSFVYCTKINPACRAGARNGSVFAHDLNLSWKDSKYSLITEKESQCLLTYSTNSQNKPHMKHVYTNESVTWFVKLGPYLSFPEASVLQSSRTEISESWTKISTVKSQSICTEMPEQTV